MSSPMMSVAAPPGIKPVSGPRVEHAPLDEVAGVRRMGGLAVADAVLGSESLLMPCYSHLKSWNPVGMVPMELTEVEAESTIEVIVLAEPSLTIEKVANADEADDGRFGSILPTTVDVMPANTVMIPSDDLEDLVLRGRCRDIQDPGLALDDGFVAVRVVERHLGGCEE